MAVIFYGASTCPLCGKIIENKNDIIVFPNLISNIKDPIFTLSDAAVHAQCLKNSQLEKKALYFKKKYFDTLPSFESNSNIDINKLKKLKIFFNTGLLTSDENEFLYKYNFINVPLLNLKGWEDRQTFIDAILRFKDEGKWESFGDFNYLDYLVKNLSGN